MSSKSKRFAHPGYHWREELVENLQAYVKSDIDMSILYNLIREYVPGFSPEEDPSTDASWLFTSSLGTNNYWWKQEIEDIGKEFAERSNGLNDKLAKEIFEIHRWKVNEPVEGISIIDKRGRWKYDAYKNKIAVEVELSSRGQIFKDSFKFIIGQAMSQVDVGIIMVPKNLKGKGKPYLGSVRRNWHAFYTPLPMLQMAFYGFPVGA